MKKVVIGMMFFVTMFISTNSFASDVFGYFKVENDTTKTDRLIFLSEKECQLDDEKFKVIRISKRNDGVQIYFVEMKHAKDDYVNELKKMPDSELDIMTGNIFVRKDGEDIFIEAPFTKRRKYVRILHDDWAKALTK